MKVTAAEDGDATTDPDVTLVQAISSTDDSDYNALADQTVTVSITENDVVGVNIDPTSLTVTEGDATGSSYTVKLTSQPAGDVTVTVSGQAGTDLTVSGTTLTNNVLTFTDQNWSTAQTVKVTAAEDDDATTDPDMTPVHAISSTDDSDYHALADQSVTVSITENDVVGVTINPTSLTVTEGDAAGASYTVELTSQPAGDVTVTISGHSGTDVTLTGSTLSVDDELTFTSDNWGTIQTVKVTAGEDDDATTDPDVTLVHDISSTDDTAYNALADQTVTVSITENDAVGVTINPTSLTVTEGDATGASYTVKLNTQPTGNVTVTISGHSGTDVTLSGTSLSGDDVLTFTDQNWGTAQTVKVVPGEDDDATTDPDVTLAHDVSSTDDTDYNALADQTVTVSVSITENDVVGVTINPTTLTVTEGDAAGASYTVKLTSQPAGDVIIAISGQAGTDLTLSGTTLTNNVLTFTDQNWSTAQTVKVKAAEDDDATTDPDVTLVQAISSTDDSDYNALADQTVTVSITENDVVGVNINPTSLTVTEGDATGASYTVVLTTQPAGDVTVTVSGHTGTDLTVSGTTLTNNVLTFTDQNWGTAQTVKVTAGEDDDATTDPDVTLVQAISSTDDSDYNALADQTVTVSITENDVVGVNINPTSLTVTEGDATGASYTVVLTTQPAGDVTVTVSGHTGTDLTVSGTTLTNNVLTFTDQNWGTAQTVKVTAGEDDDATTDPDVTLVQAISSTDDSDYHALADQTVTVSITENDAVGVTIDPTTLTVNEGDAAGASYTVVLTSQPAGDVTVTISGQAGTDLTVSGTTLTNNELTFTTENWGTVQTVKVTAAEDGDATTDPDVTLVQAISSTDDSDYNALADQTVTVSITENDVVGVNIDPTSLTVTEGDATGSSYTVKLTSQPAGDVTVTVSGQAGTDLTVSGTTLTNNVLTFTDQNWSTAQTVKVTAAEDDDATTDPDMTLVHAISSTDDSDYHALADQSVTVSITENDVVGVTINPTSLTVTEGDAAGASYTVELTSQPAGDVTVTISGHSGTDVTLTGSTLSVDDELTFTSDNWGTIQTVKVTAGEDDDATTDPDVTLVHDINSTDDSDYNALADQSVTVSITENDAVGVTINPTSLTVTEGDATGSSYTVKLNTQPAGDVTVTVSGHAGTDLTVSGTTLTNNVLTFTDQNWGTAQTVKVVPGEDDDATTDPDVTLVHDINSTDDSDYNALADQSVTVSITENDAVGVTVTFEKEVHYTIEGASGAAGVEVLLSAPLATEVTIPITVLSESTADTGDYLVDDHAGYASDPGLTFNPGETFGYVLIKAVLDTLDEETETVVLGFGTLPAGVSEGSPSRSTVEIKDAVQVSFAESSYTVEEGGDGVEVVVKLNKPSNNLRVPLTANGHGGADDSDFTGVPQEVVFKDDETESTFTFVAMDDSEEENGEMVRLGFGAFSEGMVAIFPDSAMVMIDDSAGAPESAMVMIDDPAGAPAPRHFVAYWPTQTSITLTWFTVETTAEYKLEFRKQGETGWTRISGDFDHLPSTTDHRDAFGVAAGLDCNTRYDFRLSARGSGETRNDGDRYPSGSFGSYAATSAQTGECAQEERVTNLLVSIEPGCATLTWTPPSGDRDTGYRVERYSYTGSDRSEPETLVEQADRVATRYEDCSAEYRTPGAEHVYSVTALDNNPEPDEEGAFGTAYTSILVFGPSREPEGPRNVRLTHDAQSSRGLAWDAPRDPWLTTVKTARAGSGSQPVVTDPWTTGYRVERREYRRTEGGGWALPEFDEDKALWSATMTVGASTTGTPATGYFGLGSNTYGALTQTTFIHPVGSGSWTVVGLAVSSATGLRLVIQEVPPNTENLSHDAFEHWVLVVDGRSFPFELPEGVVDVVLQPTWPSPGLSWTDGQEVSVQLVERLDWEALRDETDGGTGTSFTDSEDKGDKQYVYRVWAYNDRGLSHYSWRGDWGFNGGDPGGDPEPAVYIPPPPAQQEGGETPSNTPATGAPAIGGTPQVDQTLTADISGIAAEDGLDDATYRYQWTAGGSDIAGATGSSYALTSSEEGQTIQVRVSFTDDSDNQESLTSAATAAVAAPLPELTASLPHSGFQSSRHLGAGDRPQVVVAFSLPVASFEKSTPSVSLTGATVSSVRRHQEDGLENAWMFFLDPDGNDDIVFRLVAGQPCDSGGICAGDGTTLSAAPEPRVLPGPEEEEDGPEPPPQEEEEEEQEQAGDDQQTPQSPPPAPTSLTATVNADGHIVLSWTAPDDDSITGYQVLRRRTGEGESTLLVYVADTQSTATTFTDTGVAAGVKHVYRVKAINAAGLSGWSNYVNPTP